MAKDLTIDFETLIKGCRDIEAALGLPAGCIVDLPRETSDWSFVIKVAALVEAAITHLLAAQVDAGPMADLIGKLQMQGATGKLPLAKNWNLITQSDSDFGVGVTRLRNTLAHDPQFLAFDFAAYLGQLKGEDRKAFLKWASLGRERSAEDSGHLKILRFQIWAQAVQILGKARLQKGEAAMTRDLERMYREIGESFVTRPPDEEYV